MTITPAVTARPLSANMAVLLATPAAPVIPAEQPAQVVPDAQREQRRAQLRAYLYAPRTERSQAWVNAYEFAKAGFGVFPLGDVGPESRLDGKAPLTRNGHKDATTDVNQIAAWEQEFPGANVGIVPPDGVAIVDFDTRHDGLRACNEMVAKGLLPRETFVAQTGTGGWHVFVKVPSGYALGNFRDVAPGISVINHGGGSPGYVVAPGSVNWVTGGAYKIACGSPVAPAPDALCDRMRPRGSRNAERIATEDIDDVRRARAAEDHFAIDADKAVQDVEAAAIDYAVRALEPVAAPGQRYTVLTKMGALLARLGWSAASVETFAREFIARYGGDNVEHGVRGCVNSMSYPSGYYDLTAMMPSYARGQLAAALDAIPNPYGQAIRDGRAQLAASVNLPSPTPPVTLATNPQPANSPPTNTERDIYFDSLDDGLPPKPITRLVEGLDVVDGTMTYVAGPPNAGKTPTALLLAYSIANGLPFGDRPATVRPVIYANFEKRFDAKQKSHRIAQGLGVKQSSVHIAHLGAVGAALSAEGVTNPTASLIRHVKQERERTGLVPLVIVDTYASSVDDLDANDNLYAQPLKHFKAALHAECDSPIVVLVHTRKRDDETQPFGRSDIAGSGQIVGLCEAIIGLHHPDPTNAHIVELTSVRSITVDMKPLRIEWCGGDGEPLTAHVIGEAERQQAQATKPKRVSKDDFESEVVEAVAREFSGAYAHSIPSAGVTVREMQARLSAGFRGNGRAYAAVKKALAAAKTDGLAVEVPCVRGKRYRARTPDEIAADAARDEEMLRRSLHEANFLARAELARSNPPVTPPGQWPPNVQAPITTTYAQGAHQ